MANRKPASGPIVDSETQIKVLPKRAWYLRAPLGCVIAALLLLTSCKQDKHFYCASVGDREGRQCMTRATECRGSSGFHCFSTSLAYCFSRRALLGPVGHLPPVPDVTTPRLLVCAPTMQECVAMIEAIVPEYRAYFDASKCIATPAREAPE